MGQVSSSNREKDTSLDSYNFHYLIVCLFLLKKFKQIDRFLVMTNFFFSSGRFLNPWTCQENITFSTLNRIFKERLIGLVLYNIIQLNAYFPFYGFLIF